MKKEIRIVNVDVRARKDGDETVLYGTPIVYGVEAKGWGFVEKINPGAATKALKKSRAKVTYNHDEKRLPLARMGSEGLEIKEDKSGVHIEVRNIPSYGQDVVEAVERGFVDKMSFAFTVNKKGEVWDLNGDVDKREINEFDELFDFSFVDEPFYDTTSAGVRDNGDFTTAELRRKEFKKSDTASRANGGNAADIENEDIEIDLLIASTGGSQ